MDLWLCVLCSLQIWIAIRHQTKMREKHEKVLTLMIFWIHAIFTHSSKTFRHPNGKINVKYVLTWINSGILEWHIIHWTNWKIFFLFYYWGNILHCFSKWVKTELMIWSDAPATVVNHPGWIFKWILWFFFVTWINESSMDVDWNPHRYSVILCVSLCFTSHQRLIIASCLINVIFIFSRNIY